MEEFNRQEADEIILKVADASENNKNWDFSDYIGRLRLMKDELTASLKEDSFDWLNNKDYMETIDSLLATIEWLQESRTLVTDDSRKKILSFQHPELWNDKGLSDDKYDPTKDIKEVTDKLKAVRAAFDKSADWSAEQQAARAEYSQIKNALNALMWKDVDQGKPDLDEPWYDPTKDIKEVTDKLKAVRAVFDKSADWSAEQQAARAEYSQIKNALNALMWKDVDQGKPDLDEPWYDPTKDITENDLNHPGLGDKIVTRYSSWDDLTDKVFTVDEIKSQLDVYRKEFEDASESLLDNDMQSSPEVDSVIEKRDEARKNFLKLRNKLKVLNWDTAEEFKVGYDALGVDEKFYEDAAAVLKA